MGKPAWGQQEPGGLSGQLRTLNQVCGALAGNGKTAGYQPPAFAELPVCSGPCLPTSASIVSTVNGVIPSPTL